MSIEAEMQQNGTLIDGSVSLILVESNQQNIPEFSEFVLIITILGMSALILILKKKKKTML
jgi:hypothetical protein